jgi:uncharacterized protein YjbI with pentapeptide repeats
LHLRRSCARNAANPLHPFLFDRSPQYVAPLIQFLRTGELVIDPHVSKRGVRVEAEYWGMTRVTALLCNVDEEFEGENDQDEDIAVASVGQHRERERCSQNARASNASPSSGSTDATTLGMDRQQDVVSKTKRRCPPACCTRNELLASLRTMPSDSGLRLRGMCLNGISFSRLDLSNTNFEWCSLIACDFSDAELSRTNFSKAMASESNFSRCVMRHALCLDANFSNCLFEKAQVSDSNFTGSNMQYLHAKQCDFSRAVLTQCDLSFADLCGTVLFQSQMRFTNLSGVERCGTSISMGGVVA